MAKMNILFGGFSTYSCILIAFKLYSIFLINKKNTEKSLNNCYYKVVN